MRSRRGKRATGERSAYEHALAYLVRREHSRQELRAKLVHAGHAADEVEEALDRLVADHYQSDARFAEMLVRSRVRRGYGPLRLRAELNSHQLDESLVEGSIAQAEVDWPQAARRQLERRYSTPPVDRNDALKRMQFLARRGFPADLARQAVQSPGAEQ